MASKIKNDWRVKESYQFMGGVVIIEFTNYNRKARFSHKKVRINQRSKKVEIYYEGRGGARLHKKLKLSKGYRKMAISQRGNFYGQKRRRSKRKYY